MVRKKEMLGLKMLCKVTLTEITIVNHGCYVHFLFPVLLMAQLTLLMILKRPSQLPKDVWF